MTILSILEGGDKVIIENIDLLAKDYFEKKGKRLNKGCPSCVIEMVLTLKHIYKMTKFAFIRTAASYKNLKGDKVTISNSTMTDKKALEFLKTKPSRIRLFSVYPSNWKDLMEGKSETKKEKENRIAIEAEMIEAKKTIIVAEEKDKEVADLIAKEKAAEEKVEKIANAIIKEEKSTEELKRNTKPSRDDLMKMGLKDLRAAWPGVKAAKTKDFVNKVLAL